MAGDESQSELTAGYTPEQREAYLRGLRILAKFAVRRPHEAQSGGVRDSAGRRGGGMKLRLQSLPSSAWQAVSSPPNLTIDRTIFEKCLGLASSPKPVDGRS